MRGEPEEKIEENGFDFLKILEEELEGLREAEERDRAVFEYQKDLEELELLEGLTGMEDLLLFNDLESGLE